MLLARIIEAIKPVTLEMLQTAWREIEYCLNVLLETEGAIVETY